MTKTLQLRAIDYARLSDGEDADKNVPTIPVQHEGNQALIAREGYQTVAVLHDVNISAARDSRGNLKVRPDFEEAMRMIRDGEADVIVARDESRLSRDEATTAMMLATCWAAGAILHYLEGGKLDPSDHTDRFRANTMAGANALYVAQNRKHQIDRNQKRVRDGMPIEGLRGFGYAKDRVTPLEPEATWVREAYAHILAGKSLRSFVIKLNEAGVLTPRGKQWSQQGLRVHLLNPRNKGVLRYRGVEQPDSKITPLVDAETFDQAMLILSDPSRVASRGRPRDKTLLSGIATCACGSVVNSYITAKRDGYVPSYRCRAQATHTQDKSQRHATVPREALEVAVEGAIFSELVERASEPEEEQLSITPLLVEKAELERQRTTAQELALMPGANLAHVRKTLAGLAASIEGVEAQILAARNASQDSVQAIARALRDAQEHYLDEVVESGKWDTAGHLTGVIAAQKIFRERWEAMPMEERRELVRSLLEVTIYPANGRRRKLTLDEAMAGAQVPPRYVIKTKRRSDGPQLKPIPYPTDDDRQETQQ